MGCPGCPHQLLGGSELTQWGLPLCQAHVQEGDAKRCWTASSLGGESLAREQAASSTVFCYKQPTLRSPPHPSTAISLNPLSTGRSGYYHHISQMVTPRHKAVQRVTQGRGSVAELGVNTGGRFSSVCSCFSSPLLPCSSFNFA